MDSENVFAPPEANLDASSDTTSTKLPLADKSDRLAAFVIDAVIGIALSFPFLYFTGFWEKSRELTLMPMESVSIVLFSFVLYLVIHGYFLAKSGQTIGKKLLKIKIVDIETDEILPLWKVYCFRFLPQNLVMQLPLIGMIVGLADVLFIFRENRRCLHDYVARTRVVSIAKH